MSLITSIIPKNEITLKFYRMLRRFEPLSKNYPVDLNFEITTVCNSKCVFCTHEGLVKSGKKEVKHMDFNLIKLICDKFVEMTKEIPSEKLTVNVTGLGEPLLHPKYFETIELIRHCFPKARIVTNTNGICLDERKAKKIIESSLDHLCISIRFLDKDVYKQQSGVDKYETVVSNVKNFLKMKGIKPSCNLQVFDTEDFQKFVNIWKPYLNKNDNILIERYVNLVGWCNGEYKKPRKNPCRQLWRLIMVDVNGYVYPCCEGIWIPFNEDLCLGYITDEKMI
ncbi:MAG: radical SAM/SPASM domain-containing protein [Thermoplasmatota archaeon]|jgi:MoaA/NifB/PqqE/SkfB family radical SAM enzyme